MSTWSGLSTNATFTRCAPGVTVPTLLIELTGDHVAFPADSTRMFAALGATDNTHAPRPRHPLRRPHHPGEPPGSTSAGVLVADWLTDRIGGQA